MVSITLQRIQMILIAVLIPLGILYWYVQGYEINVQDVLLPATPVVRIAEIPVRVEIAASNEARMQGLSGRDALGDVDGLLFVFPEVGYHAMWMKDMRFPIDIIWISEDLKVISIDTNVTPDTFPRQFRPTSPAKYALETNVHFSETYSFKPGDEVVLPRNIEGL